MKNIIRIGIGAVFVIAALLKLLSVDAFEIYIYSFNVFSFLVTTFVSRIIIAGELLLGLFLIFNIYSKTTWRLCVAALVLFVLFLLYVLIFRNDDNCHCFGELVEISPVQSLIKNIFILILLFIIREKDKNTANKFMVLILSVLTFIVSFVLLPADSIYNMIYSSDENISSVDLYESFENVKKIDFENDDFVIDSTAVFSLDDDKEMIAIVSSTCKYCKLGVKKLSLIMQNKGIDADKLNIFIWGSESGICRFRQETLTEDYDFWYIMPNEAIDICLGKFPIFIWTGKDKNITKAGDFRSIDDNLEL